MPCRELWQSGDIFGCLNREGGVRLASSRVEAGLLLTLLQCNSQPRTTKDYLAQGINSVKVEKLALEGGEQCLCVCNKESSGLRVRRPESSFPFSYQLAAGELHHHSWT